MARFHTVHRVQSEAREGALGAIAPSAGPFAPSRASLCTLCTVWNLAIVVALPVDFIANGFAPSGISAWLRAWYIECKAKRQRVQRDGGAIADAIAISPNAPAWLRAWVQNNFGRGLLLPSREGSSIAWALRYSITLGAHCWCHLGRRISVAWVLR